MPGFEQVWSAVIFKHGPQVVDVSALASLNYASEFFSADLSQRVAVNRAARG